jgi:hypothetical protein
MQENTELELSLPYARAEYLVLLFYELGICEQGDNGAKVVSWKELEAWQENTQRKLSPWEVITIRDMSRAYVNEYYAGSDKLRPAPYTDVEMNVEKRNLVADKFKSWKASLKKE